MTMTRRDAIAEAVLSSRVLFGRYLVGFDDSNHTRQAPNLPNHVAWCLGHCALTMLRAAEKIDHKIPPESDFYTPQMVPAVHSAHAAGAATLVRTAQHAPPSRYDCETVAFQSTPVDNPVLYPRFTRCVEIFDRATDRYAELIRSLPETRLDEMIRWGQIEIPIWASGLRMAFHNGTHSGQVADLRRALGMRSIFT